MNGAYFLEGIALGFGSGITPGPMLALVLAASLRSGFRAGAVVALAPLVTDLPIILLCLTVLGRLPPPAIAVVSIAGGAVLAWFAYEAARDAGTVSLDALRDDAAHADDVGHSLRRGVVVNLLNPAPWLFWMSVGGPLLRDAWSHGGLIAASFIVPFYLLLVGTKVAVAWAAGTGRSRLGDRGYRILLSGAAALLGMLALLLLRNGVTALMQTS